MIKRKLFLLSVGLVIVAGFVSVASAQGRYGNVYSREDVSSFIRNLEDSSDAFSRDFRSGNTNGSERRTVSNFENSVDRLRNRFDSNNNWWQSRNQVQDMLR